LEISVTTTATKLKKLFSSTVVRHGTEMLAAIADANAERKIKLARHLVGQYLKSYDAKLAATMEAFQKLGRPVSKADVETVAAGLLPWEGSNEPVRLVLKKKGETGNYRSIMNFGVENRALQYLVKAPLVATADLHPNQYGSVGVQAAIAHVAKLMAQGHLWSVEIDIENCFPSFKEERLYEFLLLPKKVIRHVIMASPLNIVSGNLYDFFGPAENGVDPILVTEAIAEARRGIPQGSAASNIASEMFLAIPIKKLPTCGVAIGYADNTLLMATNEKDAGSITEAFGSALKAHPVGLLRPKIKSISKPGEPVDYLGYRLTLFGEKVKIEPHPENDVVFEGEMKKGVLRLEKSKLPPKERQKIAKNLQRKVKSWTGAFGLCDGIADRRNWWLAKVQHANNHGLKA
jgi:hypothetical protein